jgi:superfamily I DNA/RNA helicase/mRNA-degrading endonuclease RelE of RelBE toxin-antitoxin system
MAYTLTFKPDFMKDFIRFGRNEQTRITGFLTEIESSPNIQRGNAIKRLVYTNNLWRYRFGNYRIIYAVFPKRNVVVLLVIGKRDDVYDRLNYNPKAPNLADFTEVLEDVLNPDIEAPSKWSDFLRPEHQEDTPLSYIFTKNQLRDWNIPEEFHDALNICRTEESLLIAPIPDFYKEKIIDLMSPPGRIEDIVQQPTRVIERVDSLLDYNDGNIGLLDFLLLLDEEQEKLVDWSLSGPTLVKGGAGSGKSTIALYRARSLCQIAKQQLLPPRILFTTYTNSLVSASKQLLEHLLVDTNVEIEVTTIDKIARRIVNEIDGRPNIEQESFFLGAIRASKFALDISGDTKLQNFLSQTQIESLGNGYIKDEFDWIIQGRGLQTLEEYLIADRRGRGYGFNENMRRQIWKIYTNYLSYLDRQNKSLTWFMLRNRAYDLIKSGKSKEKKFDYVLIDEAQDLSPMAIKLCLELCESPAGLFLTADAGQSIYNRSFSWNKVHDDLKVRGRTRILKRNYRTTREIAIAANQILVNSEAGDEEVLDQFFVHSGPKPVFFEARNDDEMLYWTCQSIKNALHSLHLPNSAAAVLSTTNSMAKRLASQLSENGLATEYMTGKNLDLQKKCVKSLVIHSAKGLEFPIVAIPYVEEGILPGIQDEYAEDVKEQIALECKVFHVGCTRAMRRLFVSFRKDQKSRFMEDETYWLKGTL